MFSQKKNNEKTLLAVGVPGSRGAKSRLRRHFCLFLAFCLLLIPFSVAQAQVTEEWVARYNGPVNGNDSTSDVAVDSSGYVYVTGSSPGSGTGPNDYLTIKYDPNGNQLWEARYNGPANSNDTASDIAVDSSGNVYVTGQSNGSGTANDYATIKYDTNGNQLWVARYNGPGNEYDFGMAIAVDASGNVYVTGFSDGITHAYDYATIKYDTNGNQLWVARYDGPKQDTEYAYAIAVDASGNVYVTGGSDGNGTGKDYATIKYDPNGNPLWVARYNGPGNGGDTAYALAVDSSGNVYVTGESLGSGTGQDYATIKYDTNGNQLWVQRYNGPGNGDDRASDIAVDGSGNVFVTGKSLGSGIGIDYATIKYDPNGNELWVARYERPVSSDDYAPALAVDASGNVYVTGYDWNGTSFDYVTIKYDTNGNQIWVARYNGPADGDDHAHAIAVDSSENVYVTGGSTGIGTGLDYATIKYSQQPPPLSLVCKTDKDIYNPGESVQVFADVDNPGDSFSANLLGGIIVLRTPPKKPLILRGEVITKTIDPGLNPDILLYTSPPIITTIAPKVTHGAFCVLYTDVDGILAIDTSTWGLTEPPSVAKEKFFSDFIRSYINRYGLEKLMNANADEFLAAPVSDAPDQTALSSAFPSIANPETWIPFQLSEPGEVTITIYNASGQLVKTLDLGHKEAGYYLNKEKAAFWNGRNDRGERVASGIYFYTMRTRNFTATRKVVILK